MQVNEIHRWVGGIHKTPPLTHIVYSLPMNRLSDINSVALNVILFEC